jgi:hypothetical protein
VLHSVQTGSEAHPASPVQFVPGALSPGVMRLERALLTPPSTAAVKNGADIA